MRSYENKKLSQLLLADKQKLKGSDMALCHAYLQSNERGFSQLVIERAPIDLKEFQEMIEQMRLYDIKHFILADSSTILMECLHICLAQKCKIMEPFEHEIDKYYIIKGLQIKV